MAIPLARPAWIDGERANLRDHHPEAFERLREPRLRWSKGLLPITDDAFTHGLTPDIQADRYVPYREKRQPPGS